MLTVYRKNEGKVLTEDEIKAKIEYCYMGVDQHQLNRKQWCHSDQGAHPVMTSYGENRMEKLADDLLLE